jgi:cytochrome P450
VAGAHTTSGTLTLLFSHLLQNPEILKRVEAEIDEQVSDSGAPVSINGLEQKLPYFMACVNENFRINPVFTMTLPRVVIAPEGTEIDGHWVPRGVSTLLALGL